MVHKNSKWNISQKKGEDISHKYIIEILEDSKNNMISLSELTIILNQRTKHIKINHRNKKKTITLYLKCIYGSIINFLTNFNFYKVIKNNESIYIELIGDKLIDRHNIKNLYNDWIMVSDEDDFIVI
jgi:hypothetical protein